MKISLEALRGYILEEVLAYLIRNTGYRLLVDAVQDPAELGWERNGLVVKGRGAVHQVDVLGELMWIPAFTYPLRLFVEAKFRGEKTGISTVRNAVGTILDVNQNNLPQSVRASGINPQLRPKYQYVGAIFSTSGFSQPAMDMALAHGVSLIDLRIPGFQSLFDGITEAADTIQRTFQQEQSNRDAIPGNYANHLPRGEFTQALRSALRRELNTQPYVDFEDRDDIRQVNRGLIDQIIPLLRASVESAEELGELFVGMGQGPYMIVLKADNRARFLEFARHNPAHNVHITWSSRVNEGRTWFIEPQGYPNGYRLSFKLPDVIGDWIFSEKNVLRAAMNAKQKFFSNITIYRHEEGNDSLIRLNFMPRDIDRRNF